MARIVLLLCLLPACLACDCKDCTGAGAGACKDCGASAACKDCKGEACRGCGCREAAPAALALPQADTAAVISDAEAVNIAPPQKDCGLCKDGAACKTCRACKDGTCRACKDCDACKDCGSQQAGALSLPDTMADSSAIVAEYPAGPAQEAQVQQAEAQDGSSSVLGAIAAFVAVMLVGGLLMWIAVRFCGVKKFWNLQESEQLMDEESASDDSRSAS